MREPGGAETAKHHPVSRATCHAGLGPALRGDKRPSRAGLDPALRSDKRPCRAEGGSQSYDQSQQLRYPQSTVMFTDRKLGK